ncbi:cytochrome b562 [Spirabiliibacterium falconis]|uniref:cytochrome b562 n=1 Tax=Spirabiliibacterium falconis TaxID=572023 RepID=UPI001AADF91E|nr:cytochrome b562 [Spirabiliibacterium falconis]MBE2894307.1 cytochrome B562 [Spirabiliibacterium falconis]
MQLNMMMKSAVFAGLLGVSTVTLAHGALSQDMREIMQSTRQALRADNEQDFIKAMESVIAAAQRSKDQTPHRLADNAPDSAEMQDYQNGMQAFIEAAEQAKDDAVQGKLDDAKAHVQTLYDLRDTYHPKYK